MKSGPARPANLQDLQGGTPERGMWPRGNQRSYGAVPQRGHANEDEIQHAAAAIPGRGNSTLDPTAKTAPAGLRGPDKDPSGSALQYVRAQPDMAALSSAKLQGGLED